jgi:mycothiol synthase
VTVLERPASRADLPAIVELWLAFDTAVRGFPDSDESDVTQDWDTPGFDLEKSTRVLVDDGRLVGYALVNGTETDSTVHPDRFGQGLEERLARWVETAAAPGTVLEHFAPVALPVLNDVLATCGWSPARTFWRMRIAHDTPAPAPTWPAGVVVRGFDVERDARQVHALVQTAFADIGGEHARTFEEWSVSVLDPVRLEPSLYLVAEDDGELVGAAVTQDMASDYGFVRQLAVPRAHRGRGTGRALLLEAFARHAARGLPRTELGVDAANRTGATRLYESVGMRISEEFTRWEKQVPAGGRPGR